LSEKSVLVIGAGVAGIQAAIDVANQGIKTYLVEKSPSVGGHMAQLDKTFPTLDCSACILTPKMVDVARHPHIELLTYSEVKEVSGTAGNFTVKIEKKPRYIDENTCTGCGHCAIHCPVEVPSEFDEGIGVRRAIYVPFPQAVPLVYTIDKDACIECELCQNICEAGAVKYDQEPEEIEVNVGSVIVATGYDLFDATNLKNYGYGVYDNVLSSLEFERLLSASGPAGGHVFRLSDGKIPRRIAFLQCVGSRDPEHGMPYCSRVCCMYAIKNAVLAKDHIHGGCDTTIFYIDVRAFGKGFEEFYQNAQTRFGVKFVRGKVGEIVEDEATKKLLLRVENTETGELNQEEFDMVVLSSGLVPSQGSSEVGKLLNLPTDQYGFFKEASRILPVDTKIEGVYMAGVCESVKDIPDGVGQASAAAMRASLKAI
jgi:heterodisulfide reductase subunit A